MHTNDPSYLENVFKDEDFQASLDEFVRLVKINLGDDDFHSRLLLDLSLVVRFASDSEFPDDVRTYVKSARLAETIDTLVEDVREAGLIAEDGVVRQVHRAWEELESHLFRVKDEAYKARKPFHSQRWRLGDDMVEEAHRHFDFEKKFGKIEWDLSELAGYAYQTQDGCRVREYASDLDIPGTIAKASAAADSPSEEVKMRMLQKYDAFLKFIVEDYSNMPSVPEIAFAGWNK